VVRLEKGDVSEDEAAASIAKAVAGEGVNVERAFTGRSNLFAAQAGVLVVDRAAVDRINGVDEAITFATLSAFKPVVEGEMIATVKTHSVRLSKLSCAMPPSMSRAKDTLRIAPYVIKKVGVGLDLAARARAKGDRQDLAGDGRKRLAASRRQHHCRTPCAARRG